MVRSNELALVPAGTQPRYRMVEPKLALMEKRIAQLDAVLVKLVCSFVCQVKKGLLCSVVEKAVPEDEYDSRFSGESLGGRTQNPRLGLRSTASLDDLVSGEIWYVHLLA